MSSRRGSGHRLLLLSLNCIARGTMAGPVENVERELDKVMNKLTDLRKHRDQTLDEFIQQIESYQRDLSILSCK